MAILPRRERMRSCSATRTSKRNTYRTRTGNLGVPVGVRDRDGVLRETYARDDT